MNKRDMTADKQVQSEDAAVDQVLGGERLAGDDQTGETETAQAELAESQDRLLRVQAELENVRKRSQRELQDTLRYAGLPLLRDLLPVLDNVDRAIESAEQSPDTTGLLDGVKMVADQLREVLARYQCSHIDALHQPFDPNFHEAISQQPSDEHPSGTVVHVVQSGYKLHDRVVRPAQVVVSTAVPNATE